MTEMGVAICKLAKVLHKVAVRLILCSDTCSGEATGCELGASVLLVG